MVPAPDASLGGSEFGDGREPELSHGGLRYQGRLAPQEQALEEWWQTHPEEVWLGPPHLREE